MNEENLVTALNKRWDEESLKNMSLVLEHGLVNLRRGHLHGWRSAPFPILPDRFRQQSGIEPLATDDRRTLSQAQMPLSQFQLSLELTNLIPFGARDIVNFARALQRSGSDLVAEHDLVQIFGRNRLEERFESTFKTVVRDSSQHSLVSQALDIVLEAGAGPSLQRALKDREHFATIVQLSMLTWVHNRSALASALITAMRRRVQGAPVEDKISSIPGETALLGFLKSCEEQTGAFPWQRWFDGVRVKLGIQGRESEEVLNAVVPVCLLQGLLDMLTAVQSFPDDRMVFIKTYRGLVTIVVWANCLLGLTVSVHTKDGTISFGDGNATVIIDATDTSDHSNICLFDASNELILEITDTEEFETIESEIKHLAKGYGTRILTRATKDMTVVRHIAHFCSAIALQISRRLQVVHSPGMILGPPRVQALESLKPLPHTASKSPEYKHPIGKRCPKQHELPTTNEIILRTAESFLFDGLQIDRDLVGEYISTVSEANSAERGSFPRMINAFLDIEPDIPLRLALVMLAFSTITDLHQCELWRLGTLGTLDNARITKYLSPCWTGEETIPLTHDDWYQVLGSLMLGSRCWSAPEIITHSSLIRNWGWTMWMSSFGEYRDPLAITPGVLTVRPGVPSIHGERRHSVTDGPNEGPSGAYCRPSTMLSGEKRTWECIVKTEVKKPLVAIREDEFIVSVRCVIDERNFCRGYRELHRLRWNAWIAPECNHDCDVQAQLAPDIGVVRDLIWSRQHSMPRVCICAVRGNPGARWAAMAGANDLRNILLAGSRNCIQCVVDGVCDREFNWLIVA